MAISNQFLEQNRPYIHSDIFNFRLDAAHQLGVGSSTAQNLGNAIDNLEKIRDYLKAEADKFLDGKTYQQVSKELFYPDNYIKEALKVIRNPDFINVILSAVQFNGESISQFIKENITQTAKKTLEKIEHSSNFDEATSYLVSYIFNKRSNNSQQDINKKLIKVFNEQLQEERHYFTPSKSFHSDVKKILKKISPIDKDKIWGAFIDDFKKNLAQGGYAEDIEKNFLTNLKNPFYRALDNAVSLRDSSNIQGWLGEDFKDALWKAIETDKGIQLSFKAINVGKKSEADLIKQVREKFGRSIQDMTLTSKSGQSHSDWVLQNKNGFIVRAQDKNSSTFLKRLEDDSDNFIQPIKLHDKIQYLSLKEKLQNYRYNYINKEDQKLLDYLIANTLWFSKRASQSKKKGLQAKGVNKSTGQQYNSKLQGIREIINRILAEDIGFFVGFDAFTLSKRFDGSFIFTGGNNTFFVIDNIILYPTYLIIEYIIKQLADYENQYNRLQVTFSAEINKKAKILEKEKDAAKDKDWKGPQYGARVLEVGKEEGFQILSKTYIDRVNLRFDLKKVLTSAYDFGSSGGMTINDIY